MHATLPLLKDTDFPAIHRGQLTTLQVNLGYRCNLSCVHCHVNAGPGRTEQSVIVMVNGDLDVEPDERFFVELSAAVNGVIADGQAIGTIANDDVARPAITIGDADVWEGDAGPRVSVGRAAAHASDPRRGR